MINTLRSNDEFGSKVPLIRGENAINSGRKCHYFEGKMPLLRRAFEEEVNEVDSASFLVGCGLLLQNILYHNAATT